MEKNENWVRVGDFLKRTRIKKGLTQEEVSKKAGVSICSLQFAEQGRQKLGLKNAYKVEMALGLEEGTLEIIEKNKE